MPTRQMLIQSLQKAAQELPEEDLLEIQRFAEYLANAQHQDGARPGIHGLPAQHDQQSCLLITYILERNRLISMVNYLADIILHAESLSTNDKWEAQEAMKKANWIQ